MDALYAHMPRLVEADFETVLTTVSQRVRRRSLVVLFTDLTVIEACAADAGLRPDAQPPTPVPWW